MTRTQRTIFIAIIIATIGFSAGAAGACPTHQGSHPTTTTTIKPEAKKPCTHVHSTSTTSMTSSTTSTSVIKSTAAVTKSSGSTAGSAGTTTTTTAALAGTDAIGRSVTTEAPQLAAATVVTQPAASQATLPFTGVRTDLEVFCAALLVALGAIFLLVAYKAKTRRLAK